MLLVNSAGPDPRKIGFIELSDNLKGFSAGAM
jgi:hypothetical protein